MIEALAWILVAMPFLNMYFVVHGLRTYLNDPGRSALLLAIWWTKAVIWFCGVVIGALAARYLAGLPVFPFNGASLMVPLLVISLLPGSLHLVIRWYDRE